MVKTEVTDIPVVDTTLKQRGDTGVYALQGKCFNCNSVVKGIFNKGYDAGAGSLGPQCPVCACRRLYWNGVMG